MSDLPPLLPELTSFVVEQLGALAVSMAILMPNGERYGCNMITHGEEDPDKPPPEILLALANTLELCAERARAIALKDAS